MKIDIPNDIGFTYPINYRTFCDGIEIKDCFYADTEEGLVKFYLRDKEDNLFLEQNEVASGMKRGTVEIQKI